MDEAYKQKLSVPIHSTLLDDFGLWRGSAETISLHGATKISKTFLYSSAKSRKKKRQTDMSHRLENIFERIQVVDNFGVTKVN